MSRRDRPTSHLTVFDPGYHRPEVVGGTRRQRQAVASRSRHVTFSSQSESGDDEYSSDSDASGEASEDFRSGRVREVGVRKISGNRRVQIHDSTLAQKTKMRNGRSHKAGDDGARNVLLLKYCIFEYVHRVVSAKCCWNLGDLAIL